MRYAIVIKKSSRNYVAYVPELPACVATGASEAEAVCEIREATRFHIETLCEHHESVPEPRSTATVVDVVALAGWRA
ncbi:MAG: type II toxin-antitoxin system HicB family antitoxin [Acidobacteriia bacterium]|nr:type II toxin-antitoxin system HicB family antitoxin [Terriglobia bacterium]